jgi:hypothetical protein
VFAIDSVVRKPSGDGKTTASPCFTPPYRETR